MLLSIFSKAETDTQGRHAKCSIPQLVKGEIVPLANKTDGGRKIMQKGRSDDVAGRGLARS